MESFQRNSLIEIDNNQWNNPDSTEMDTIEHSAESDKRTVRNKNQLPVSALSTIPCGWRFCRGG
jgi:hypothetical protein